MKINKNNTHTHTHTHTPKSNIIPIIISYHRDKKNLYDTNNIHESTKHDKALNIHIINPRTKTILNEIKCMK